MLRLKTVGFLLPDALLVLTCAYRFWLVVEKTVKDAPLLKTPETTISAPLSSFISLPDQSISILGPRRVPPVPCPAQNTHSSLSISTSVGFRSLEVQDYIDACGTLKADVAISAVDLVQTDKISAKRLEKSIDRTHAWLRDTLASEEDAGGVTLSILASIPAVDQEQQSLYLRDLVEEFQPDLAGLCFYSAPSIEVVPQELDHLPKTLLAGIASPHAILSAITLGFDLVTLPLVTQTSEQGLAFSFQFPAPTTEQRNPLAIDMWPEHHAASLEPLTPGCSCYTCTKHHRAYVHHLLQAKEMLAWTLLQIHNFQIIESFFKAIRDSIANDTFAQHVRSFSSAYQRDLPKSSGLGPRVRGYQMKSVGGGEPKRNPKAYGRLDDQLQKAAEAREVVATPDVASTGLEEHDFGKTI